MGHLENGILQRRKLHRNIQRNRQSIDFYPPKTHLIDHRLGDIRYEPRRTLESLELPSQVPGFPLSRVSRASKHLL